MHHIRPPQLAQKWRRTTGLLFAGEDPRTLGLPSCARLQVADTFGSGHWKASMGYNDRTRLWVVFALGLFIGSLMIGLAKLPVRHIVSVLENNPAAAVAAMAALFALIAGVLGPFVQWRVGRRSAVASQISANAAILTARTAGAREIARLRMSWMETLRETLAAYHSILMSLPDEPDASKQLIEDSRELSRLGTELDLLLNRQDGLQRKLWDIADKIYQTDSLAERQALDQDLVAAGRAVLKAEWEKVKSEMRGSEFQTGELSPEAGVR